MLLYVLSVVCDILIQCDLPEDKFVLSAYVRDDCTYCDNLINVLEEIDNILITNDIDLTIRKVDCDSCDCENEDENINIKIYPTIILTEDNEEIKKVEGRLTKEAIINILVKYVNIDKKIFDVKTKKNNEIIKMTYKDFARPLSGPWLILFYNEHNNILWYYLQELKKYYEDNLNVGHVHSDDMSLLKKRYNIDFFPTTMGFYNGVIQRYEKEYTFENLKEFCDLLVAPLLPEITISEFNEISKSAENSPIFIVFYKDLTLANGYFKNLAHEYRFSAKMYKSNDTDLMTKAKIQWNKTDPKDEVIENMLYLAVYRKKIFHKVKITTFHYDKINEWIFHAHYPLLTKIDGQNIYSIFKGIKPVVLLLTNGENFNDLLEKISEKMHKGAAFINFVFATLDVQKIPGFTDHLLPKLEIPAVVIVEPISQLYYTKILKWNESNFEDNVEKIVKLYESGKLKTYPFAKSHKKLWLFGLLGIVLIASFYFKKRLREKKIY